MQRNKEGDGEMNEKSINERPELNPHPKQNRGETGSRKTTI